MENAAVWRTESRTVYSIRIRPQYTSEAGQMGSGWTPFLSGLYAVMKWFTEFGHLNRGDMLTSEHYRCLNEKKKFQRRV